MSISPQEWSYGARKIDMFRIVQNWKHRFILELNAAKNTHYIKKYSK